MVYIYMLTKLGYIDGKCYHFYGIHTDPSWGIETKKIVTGRPEVPPEREDRVLDQTRIRLKRIVAEAGFAGGFHGHRCYCRADSIQKLGYSSYAIMVI